MSHLPVPVAVLNAHSAVLGKTGSGKSSLLRVLVEDLIDRGKRVVVVDPKGDWYGLKLTAEGQPANNNVIAFGDFVEEKASDVPINEHSGKHLAELISSGNRPCVIGFRGWMPGRMTKFWIDFASTLFNSKSGELYLVIDEAHNFAPKGKVMDPEAGKSLHWTNRILSEARGLGIIVLLASQRPQKVHNDSLTCCETLFAMRVVHAADRNAIEEWIEGCGDKAEGRKVLDSLAAMGKGEAFVWSPENGFGPKRVQFPMFKTFDSFAPPQLQRKVKATGWAGVDLDQVKQQFADVIQEVAANDPRLLKRRIADLERQVRVATDKPSALPPEPEYRDVPVFSDEDLKLLHAIVSKFDTIDASMEVARNLLSTIQNWKVAAESPTLKDIQQMAGRVHRVHPSQHASDMKRIDAAWEGASKPTQVVKFTRVSEGTGKSLHLPSLNSTQQRILDALAFYAWLGIRNPSLSQIGAVALIDTSGGHFSNMVGPLSKGGLVTRGNGCMALTDQGHVIANIPNNLSTMDEYHDLLRERVRQCKSAGGKTVEMLNVMINHRGNTVSTADLGQQVGIDHTGGHFANMIGPLSTLGLITRRNGMVEPTEILFPKGLK